MMARLSLLTKMSLSTGKVLSAEPAFVNLVERP